MMKVWECNLLEKGFLDFWDYYDEVEDTESLVTAFNNLKVSGTEEECAENVICSYMIKCWEDHKYEKARPKTYRARKFNPKHITDFIRTCGGYNTLGFVNLKGMCLLINKKLKGILHENHYKEIRGLKLTEKI